VAHAEGDTCHVDVIIMMMWQHQRLPHVTRFWTFRSIHGPMGKCHVAVHTTTWQTIQPPWQVTWQDDGVGMTWHDGAEVVTWPNERPPHGPVMGCHVAAGKCTRMPNNQDFQKLAGLAGANPQSAKFDRILPNLVG
jgi:hypothetical protein